MDELTDWPTEEILNTDFLFRWLNKKKFEHQYGIPLNAFVDNNGISTDCSKY